MAVSTDETFEERAARVAAELAVRRATSTVPAQVACSQCGARTNAADTDDGLCAACADAEPQPRGVWP